LAVISLVLSFIEERKMKTGWRIRWIIGSVILVPGVFFISKKFYFQGGSIYDPDRWKAEVIYFFVLLAAYYGIYVIVSLLRNNISRVEASLHLALWTILPPLWFAFERYFVFTKRDNAALLARLREGQDYSSKFWAAILAVMVAFRLGDVIRGGKD
jgi:hypothetical protein